MIDISDKKKPIAESPHQIVDCVAKFIRAGDLDGVVSMFHPNCKIAMDPTQEPMGGHDSVRQIFAPFTEAKMILAGIVTGEMINDDVAILQGSWQIKDIDGNIVGGGESTEVARKLGNGGWGYFIDCPIAVPAPR